MLLLWLWLLVYMLRLEPLVASADLVTVVVSVCVDLMDVIDLWEWVCAIVHGLVMRPSSPVIGCDVIAVLRGGSTINELVGSWSC